MNVRLASCAAAVCLIVFGSAALPVCAEEAPAQQQPAGEPQKTPEDAGKAADAAAPGPAEDDFPFKITVSQQAGPLKVAQEFKLFIKAVNAAPMDVPLQVFGSGYSWISDNASVVVKQGSADDGPTGPTLVETRIAPGSAYEETVIVSVSKRGDSTFRLAFLPLNAPHAVWSDPITVHAE